MLHYNLLEYLAWQQSKHKAKLHKFKLIEKINSECTQNALIRYWRAYWKFIMRGTYLLDN